MAVRASLQAPSLVDEPTGGGTTPREEYRRRANYRRLPALGQIDAPATEPAQRSLLYLSHSTRDSELVKEFHVAVLPVASQYGVEVFFDANIKAGQAWHETLRRRLAAADIVIFFLSPDALDSKYIQSVEIPPALERHAKTGVPIVPIVLRACGWQESPLAAFKVLPSDGMPVEEHRSRPEAWAAVIEELRPLFEQVALKPAGPTSSANALPAGVDPLQVAYLAVLEQPATLELLERLDPAQLAAAWQRWRERMPNAEPRAVLDEAARHFAHPLPPPLWQAWAESLYPDRF